MTKTNGQTLLGSPGDGDSGEHAADHGPRRRVDERLTFALTIKQPRNGGFIVDPEGPNEAAFGRYSELEDYVRATMREQLDDAPTQQTRSVAQRFAPSPDRELLPPAPPQRGMLRAFIGGRG